MSLKSIRSVGADALWPVGIWSKGRRARSVVGLGLALALYSPITLSGQQAPPGHVRPSPGAPPTQQQIDPEVLRNLPPEVRAMFEQEMLTDEDDPYWEETVDRALEELESENPATRRSAVMLLGKYSVEPAHQAVVRSLEDPDAGVRMAALVSLFENPRMYPQETVVKILRLVGDDDVSIRRISSNLLPHLVHIFPLSSGPGLQGGESHRRFPDDIGAKLAEAYEDEDAIVRRNMAANHPHVRVRISAGTARRLLVDDDEQVAIQTINWGLRGLPENELNAIADRIVDHSSEIYRREVARNLQYRHGPAAMGILRALREDESPRVALEAGLALLNQEPDPQTYREMMELFARAGRPPEVAQRLIAASQFLGEESEPILREWLASSDSSHRQQAASQYLNRFGDRADDDFLRELLSDSSQQVREQALLYLLRNARRLNEELVRHVAGSRHRDVRRRAANLAAALPPREAEELLMDLLLDNVTEVRVAALQEIGRRRIDGWEEIMAMSLMDDDPAIQMNAAEWLLRGPPSPEVIDLLREFIERNPRSPLRPRIQVHLRRHSNEQERI